MKYGGTRDKPLEVTDQNGQQNTLLSLEEEKNGIEFSNIATTGKYLFCCKIDYHSEKVTALVLQ